MEMLYPSKKKISKRNEVNLNEDKIIVDCSFSTLLAAKSRKKDPSFGRGSYIWRISNEMKFHIGEVLYPREREREGSFARKDGCFVTSRKSSLSSGWKEDFEGAGYT